MYRLLHTKAPGGRVRTVAKSEVLSELLKKGEKLWRFRIVDENDELVAHKDPQRYGSETPKLLKAPAPKKPAGKKTRKKRR